MEITALNVSKEFKHLLQSGRLSFLIGSGLSAPYLKTLGNIEKRLEDLENMPDNPTKKLVRASIIKAYFDSCISQNHELRHNLPPDNDFKGVLQNYKSLLENINKIILLRRSNQLSKQVNLFTTNVDIFLEKSLETAGLEFNDGFAGTLEPSFDLSNFKKSLYKTSQHYDNKSEVPMFNLFKLHGSVTWCLDDKVIKLDSNLKSVKAVRDVLQNIPEELLCNAIKILEGNEDIKTIDELVTEYNGKENLPARPPELKECYSKIPIINPTKEKFKDTTLDSTYYDLLRMFSNELERENSVLFVMGFSFADEHIKEIVIRSINSNPTLIVYIFAYDTESVTQIKKNLDYERSFPKNNNLKIITPFGESKNDLETINTRHFQDLADNLTEESEADANG